MGFSAKPQGLGERCSHTLFTERHRHRFSEMEAGGKPTVSTSLSAPFSKQCVLTPCLCVTFWYFLEYFFFIMILFVMVCNLDYDSLKVQMTVSICQQHSVLIKVYILFLRPDVIAPLINNSVVRTFTCTGQPRNSSDSFYRYTQFTGVN